MLSAARRIFAPRRMIGKLSRSYDYVVVGAGSAGCLLANRLSADPNNRVLLVEAGGPDSNPWIHVPVGYLYTMFNRAISWCYETESQPGLNGRSIWYPRGKVLGGCSSINGMIYQRGQACDYDGWAREYGNPGWDFESVEPYFNKMLDYTVGEPGETPQNSNTPYGRGGEWRVEPPRVSWDCLDAFISAGQDAGIPAVPNFNTSDVEGCGYFQVNQTCGVRMSSFGAFVEPVAADRPNLTVLSGAQVRRVAMTKSGTAEGVELLSGIPGEGSGLIRAEREVVLAAGSIGSPQLLMLSGVGDPDELRAVSVDTVSARAGVGKNLHDHLQIRSVFKLEAEDAWTLNQAAGTLFGQAKMGVEYALLQTGPLSMAPSQVGMFAKSSDVYDTPNIQYHVQPLSLDAFGQPLHPFPGMTLSVCNLRPTSRGAVSLRDGDPRSRPIVDPNYLATDEDRKVAADSLRHVRRIMAQPAFERLAPVEHLPGAHIESDEDLARCSGDISASIFHPVGTCKMGPADDDSAVVDERLRVYGCERLRVVDASIMPQITSGNTNSPTLMIAERAADMILQDAA